MKTPSVQVCLDRQKTSSMLMDWTYDLRCCSSSLWLLLERMQSIEEEREAALIALVTQKLEELNIKISEYDRDNL
ncbi:hypothetical protein [Raoultella terrigena]|uniref:hypothetical protein n=1 Tax=Raoultella terrigena TaxID=577 RepID=UPI0011156906|nr:hypothetical protein [Raoultella terrigena]